MKKRLVGLFTALCILTAIMPVTVFSATTYTITVEAFPEYAAEISGAGEYSEGDDVTVSVNPYEGYTFLRWKENDAEVSTDSTYAFTVASDRTLVAEFDFTYSVPIWATVFKSEEDFPYEYEVYEPEKERYIDVNNSEVVFDVADYDQFITVDDAVYELTGAMSVYMEEAAMTITIPAIPDFADEDAYWDWMAAWSDGIKVIYMPHTHSYGEWEIDNKKHRKVCECEGTSEEAAHSDEDGNYLCDVCGYNMDTENDVWEYFTFGNAASNFFGIGEIQNYTAGDYAANFNTALKKLYPYQNYSALLNTILNVRQRSTWGGSCYGYSVVEALANHGKLDISDYSNYTSISNVPAPSKVSDKRVRNLLNYYYLNQFIPALRTTQYTIGTTVAKHNILSLAEYITTENEDGTQNQAMLCYFFREGIYTYGHAFIIDGGVKNADGSYVLKGYDNRYHDYTMLDGSPVAVDVTITADGKCSISIDKLSIKKGPFLYNTIPFTEVVTAFEYVKDTGIIMDRFEAMLPITSTFELASLSEESDAVLLPTLTLLPSDAKGTVDMKISDGNGLELSVADFETENEAIGNVYMITGGTATVVTEATDTEEGSVSVVPQPGGIMAELNSVSNEYSVTDVDGAISIANGSESLSITTEGALKAVINTENGSVELSENAGLFSIVISNPDNPDDEIVVSGNADGNIKATPTEDGVELEAPAGEYQVEITDESGNTDTETIIIEAPQIAFTDDGVEIKNISGTNPAVLVLSSYNAGRIVDVKIVDVNADNTINIADTGLDLANAEAVKAMLWKDVASAKPLCDTIMKAQ